MTRLVVLIGCAGAALLMIPSSASAGSSCGGSSSSSGGGGGSSSSSGGGSSSSRRPRCVERSSVVGRQRCSRFGRWDASRRPPVNFSYGTSVHSFSLDGMSFSGTASHEKDIAYKMSGNQVSGGNTVTAVSFDIRATVMLPSSSKYRWHVGTLSSIGGLQVPEKSTLMTRENLTVDTKGGIFVQAGLVSGISVPIGKLTVSAELMGGGRMISLMTETRHGDCEKSSATAATSWVVQSRVGVEKWLSPHLGVGFLAGSNLLRTKDYQVGAFMRGHFRAFDGGR